MMDCSMAILLALDVLELGTYVGQKVRTYRRRQTFSARPYPVPEANKAVFKQELDRLESIGVLSCTGPSEWLSPTFIIPKKDGRVRWIAYGDQSPDVAQEIMENLFRDFDEVDVYIDDVGIFNDDWATHLVSLDRVLSILQQHNFTVNPLKSLEEKIAAILAINPPSTVKELGSFIGAVTFYRDMYPKRSHILAPLTAQVGQKKLHWSQECQQAFDSAKALLAKDAFLRYPDHNKPFHVYCDASDLQLGAAILQEGVPVAFYSRKLNSARRNYTVGEKETLSIVETLKEYRNMLFGCKELNIHTDHKNLTFQRLNTQRVMRWRLFLEEFHPIFHYIKGEKNTLADALSRLPFSERQSPGPKDPIDQYRNRQGDIHSDDPFEDQETGHPPTTLQYNENFSMAKIDDDDLRDCFVHLPDQQGAQFLAARLQNYSRISSTGRRAFGTAHTTSCQIRAADVSTRHDGVLFHQGA